MFNNSSSKKTLLHKDTRSILTVYYVKSFILQILNGNTSIMV